MSSRTLNALIAVVVAVIGLGAILALTFQRPEGTPAELFPNAVEVRAFAWGIGNERTQVVPEGVVLTTAEIAAVRNAIFWTKEPEAVVGCCVPRHGFTFYDAKHKVLGSVEVCFECGCAQIEGEEAPNALHTWLAWDAAAIEHVLKAHGLPIEFEWDERTRTERPKA